MPAARSGLIDASTWPSGRSHPRSRPAEDVCRLHESLTLDLIHLRLEHIDGSGRANDTRQRERNVVEPKGALLDSRDGEHTTFSAKGPAKKRRCYQADRMVRRALA